MKSIAIASKETPQSEVVAETKTVKVSGIAYSGGEIEQPWSDVPLVISLTGMEFAPQVPLMDEHWNSTSAKLGEVSCSVTNDQLVIAGEITSQSDLAKHIVEDGKRSDWQLSVGANVLKSHLIPKNSTEVVNGREFSGPVMVVDKSKLREVSVVALGADEATALKISAKLSLKQPKGDLEMKEEKVNASQPQTEVSAPAAPAPAPETKTVVATATATPAVAPAPAVDAEAVRAAAVETERKRVKDIQAVCAGEFPEIEKEAINAGMSVEDTRVKVLAAIRAARPSVGPQIIVKNDVSADAESLTAALCLRSGISADALKSSGMEDKSIDAGLRDMDLSLKDVVREALRIEGREVPRSIDNGAIRAAFSTVTLPGILNNAANKKLLQSYNATPITALRVCSTGNLVDFKENERYRLTDVGDLKLVAQDGEIKEGGLVEEKATNKIETYGKKFCLTRQMIINDDLGAFMKVPTAMGNRAARLVDQLFFARLISNPTQGDGNALFSSAHKNILTGATSALSKEALQKGIELFLDQKDADGQPINVEPRTLLVPTSLKFLAQELVHGALLIAAGSTDTLRPAYNALSDQNLEVVSSPYLTNASSTGWYLFGNPAEVDTFEIGYLKGKSTPTIEQGETDFNTLGVWFRVYFDVGVREQDHRGIVKANGAA